MSADELVVRLQATLDEIEKKAATGDGWHTPECGFDRVYNGMTCTCPVPAKVLRLVQAHRDILALHPAGEGADADLCKLCDMLGQNEDCMYPCDTVRALARGYGLEDRGGDHE